MAASPAAKPDFMSSSPRPGRKSPDFKSARARSAFAGFLKLRNHRLAQGDGSSANGGKIAIIVKRHRIKMSGQHNCLRGLFPRFRTKTLLRPNSSRQ